MFYLDQYWYFPVAEVPGGLAIGHELLRPAMGIQGGAGVGFVSGLDLWSAVSEYQRRVRGLYRPQLAALMFRVTRRVQALRGYFPLLRTLNQSETADFFELVEAIAAQGLEIHLYDDGPLGSIREVPLLSDALHLIAGQIAEIFYYRLDLLERFVATPRRINLFLSQSAYQAAGGVSGGCYRPDDESIYLVVSRLYEGFYSLEPGVAPLLHELGHMLDCFNPGTERPGPARGVFPGLHPADGALFTSEAYEAFIRGKQLEMSRYERVCLQQRDSAEEPLGHPYVFQNDGEFLAGYLEMFFRNPHAFAARNPSLYAAFANLFGQDPRRWRASDFPFYLEQNRAFYSSGSVPAPHGLSLPPPAALHRAT
jgi:hypothetical protein